MFENDLQEEIIDLEEGSEVEEGEGVVKSTVDRGDDFTPETDDEEDGGSVKVDDEISPDALKDVLDEKPDIRIPKSRFDEINERMKNAEREAERLRQELEGKQQAASQGQDSGKITELELLIEQKGDAYHELLLEDPERAKDTYKELEKLRRQLISEEARVLAKQTVEQTKQEASIEETKKVVLNRAIEIVSQHSFLNDQAEDFNQEAIDEFIALRDAAYKKTGNMVEAMDKALSKVLKLYGQDEAQGQQDNTNTDALTKKLQLASQQPPRAGVGNRTAGDTRPTKVSDMSEDDFSELSEAEKRRLRGDLV
ncbi:hypothetical protein [Chrysiogenes arsenatis]|uniref:hypothetical protein n=1 Tax=Chrysiogenes arsenatis TaxID=309797 RepID=UPI00040CB61C|nr:hypothetical protein [Chrysiogenes arsenatis]